MRSATEQLEGLWKVQSMAGTAGVNLALDYEPGDVVTVRAWHPDEGFGPTEIVYAAEGYDAWYSGDLTQPDLSAETAAGILVSEYCEMKARAVARRWDAQGHDGHGHRIPRGEALALARESVARTHQR